MKINGTEMSNSPFRVYFGFLLVQMYQAILPKVTAMRQMLTWAGERLGPE